MQFWLWQRRKERAPRFGTYQDFKYIVKNIVSKKREALRGVPNFLHQQIPTEMKEKEKREHITKKYSKICLLRKIEGNPYERAFQNNIQNKI